MSSAIPVDKAIALTAAAAGIITNDEVPSDSSKIGEPQSPSNNSEASDFSPSKEIDQDGRRNLQDCDDLASESCANGFGKLYENYEYGTSSPEPTLSPEPALSPEPTLSSHSDHLKLERSNSSLSLHRYNTSSLIESSVL